MGQKGLKLKVRDPEAYNFDPRLLLECVLSMYANMSDEEVFLKHVINDSRSYKEETFAKAVRILGNAKKGISLEAEQRDRFEIMVAKLGDMHSLME